ncbi:Site-specific recombinase XerC [Caballeronia sordidicola]|uniref:Site-specific recombinase XerC n=1 Tax=Caballeronia sordidicola TaxID=196367 RepID=A0A226WT04_CABSO|nr:Site-specific recombinase XerC [Caballeronia sordidicola]
MLDATEARHLLDSIDVTTPIGLRDRAFIALMVFSFARVGAALAMRVDDIYVQHRGLWVRLREKGGKHHEIPCHHALEAYLHAYLNGAGIGDDPKGPLFRTIRRGTGQLNDTPLPQANAYAMVRRRALAAGIGTKIGNHTFRATGITAYLKNGGMLENAAAMAITHRHAPRSSMTGVTMKSVWMRSSGSVFNYFVSHSKCDCLQPATGLNRSRGRPSV